MKENKALACLILLTAGITAEMHFTCVALTLLVIAAVVARSDEK